MRGRFGQVRDDVGTVGDHRGGEDGGGLECRIGNRGGVVRADGLSRIVKHVALEVLPVHQQVDEASGPGHRGHAGLHEAGHVDLAGRHRATLTPHPQDRGGGAACPRPGVTVRVRTRGGTAGVVLQRVVTRSGDLALLLVDPPGQLIDFGLGFAVVATVLHFEVGEPRGARALQDLFARGLAGIALRDELFDECSAVVGGGHDGP